MLFLSSPTAGLDPAKTCRFVVQAYDDQGRTRVEFAPRMSGPRLRLVVRSGSPGPL